MQQKLTSFQLVSELHVAKIKKEIKIKLVFHKSSQYILKTIVVVGSNYNTIVKQWYKGHYFENKDENKGKIKHSASY